MQDQTNAKGFTTTFLSLGINANRLMRGERVRIVCKTKYQSRASASDGMPQSAKASKKRVPKKPVATKKTKSAGTRKAMMKKKKASAKDTVEELNDNYDDDVVEVVAPPSTTTEYPLIPESKSSRRCVVFCSFHILDCIEPTVFAMISESLKTTSKHLPNCSRIGVQVFVIASTSCRTISSRLRVLLRLPTRFPFQMRSFWKSTVSDVFA